MSNPLVSIIIPAYNAAKTLKDTCLSIISQSFVDWECIIVDDGSSDGTAACALSLVAQNSKFHYIYQKKSGVSIARNTAINASKGILITFLDADDIWLPTSLSLLASPFINMPHMDFVWGRALRFGEDGYIKPEIWKNYLSTGILWQDLLIYDFLPMGSFCLRRSVLPARPYFDCNVTHGEDRDFLLRTLNGLNSYSLDKTILLIRVHSKNTSKHTNKVIDSETRIMYKYLRNANISSKVYRRACSALAFRCAVVAYFTNHNILNALAWYIRAIMLDPFNINNYLLPLRKMKMKIFPAPLRHISSLRGEDYD